MTKSRVGRKFACGIVSSVTLLLAASSFAAEPGSRDKDLKAGEAAVAGLLGAPACDSAALPAAEQETDFKTYVELHEWAIGAETSTSPMPWRDLNAIAN